MRSGFKLGTFLSLCVAAAMASCGSDEPAASTCGNGVVEAGEACDGTTNGATCMSVGMGTSATPLTCDTATCQYANLAACGGGGGAGGMMP